MHRMSTLLAFAALAVACPARAVILYSINVTNDRLVTIDTETGLVTALGTSSLWAFTAGPLARHGALLYQINRGACHPDVIPRMNVIDPGGPGIVSGFVPLTLGGGSANTFGYSDLTSDGTRILLAMSTQTACDPQSRLAQLDVSGDLTLLADFSTVAADMDGLAATPSGQLYALDGRGEEAEADLYLVSPPSTYEWIGTHSLLETFTIIAGMTFADDGSLWVLERASQTAAVVRRIDPATGQELEEVALSNATGLSGLAPADMATPSRTESWGRLKVLYR